jgi:hypothetical protein
MLQDVFFGLFVLSFVVVELVKMDVWIARLGEACQAFLNDDEDDEANMGMVFDNCKTSWTRLRLDGVLLVVRVKGREQT